MEFLRSIDFEAIIKNILLNLDIELNLKLTMSHRGFRNSISPSGLTLAGKGRNGKVSVDGCRRQATRFFDPELLIGAKLIEYSEYNTLKNKLKNSAGMAMNCTVGKIIDEILCPNIVKALVDGGLWAIDQMPTLCLETGVTGNADIIIINEGKLYVLDLKTTGHKILQRANPEFTYVDDDGSTKKICEDYRRQLFAYAKSLSIMFDLPVGGLALINVCKSPESTIPCTPEMYDQEFMLPYLKEESKTVKLPLVVMSYIDYDKLNIDYGMVLNTVKIEVVKICHALKAKYPSFDSWLINDKLHEEKLLQNEKIYNKRLKELGLE